MPSMFSVKKYSDALNDLRIERGVGAEFQHNLVSVDGANRKATFKNLQDNSTVTEDYTLLHAVPPMGPLNVLKGSPIADAAGWVDVSAGTLQHNKPEYSNVWSLGDASSLPTSKTAAAIASQAPVLGNEWCKSVFLSLPDLCLVVENLFQFMDTGKVGAARYDGYTSCPVRLSSWPRGLFAYPLLYSSSLATANSCLLSSSMASFPRRPLPGISVIKSSRKGCSTT